jgi:flagellar motor switch protein FliN
METNMSEASTTDPTNNDEIPEPAGLEQTDNNEIPESATTEPADSSDTSESTIAEQTNSSDLPESETTEQTDADDWAAAMIEQTAATNDAAAKDEVTSDTQTTPVFEQFSQDGALTSARNDIDMILDIPVQLTVELGRTKIAIKNLMQLAQGSVVELDGMAGEPMDVLVNGCLIAQGEVVVVNDKFGIRLTDIITPSERIRKLNR